MQGTLTQPATGAPKTRAQRPDGAHWTMAKGTQGKMTYGAHWTMDGTEVTIDTGTGTLAKLRGFFQRTLDRAAGWTESLVAAPKMASSPLTG